ncbi:MAG: HlyD family secretion protein [Janthinobacterium lividum]
MAEDDRQHDGGRDDLHDDDPKASGKKEPESKDEGGDDEKKEEKHDDERKAAKPYVKIGLVLFLLVLVAGGIYFWLTTRGEETTDDAFTSGRTITVSPHVSGYVVELAVNDNQFVHEGQVLLRIDPRDFQATRDSAQATLDQAKGQLASSRFNVEVAKQTFPGQLKQAQGQLLLAQAQQFRAETDYKRQHSIERAATSQQQVDYSTAALDQAKAQVLQAEGQVQQSSPVVANIGTTQTRVVQQTASLAQAQAQMVQADLNLGWTVIRAPHDGWVAQRNVERGNYVQSGQSLFSIVEPEVWISANFKETQITRIRAGQSVSISVDAYPQRKLRGHVDSIQLGSGAAFSAFPPENATGNFVKIVQRVPVKVIIDEGLDPLAPLPLGISVEPTVDVK